MGDILTVDIGGSKLAAGLVDPDDASATVRCLLTAPTPADAGGESVLAAALDLARSVLASAADDGHTESPSAVGIAAAGIVSPRTREVTHATGTLPGWVGIPLTDAFTDAFGVPTHILNDVHAHGLGEAVHGPGAGHPVTLVIAVGTGVGGAVVLHGDPLLGAHGAAGHVGHLPVPEAAGLTCTCGQQGHLEAIASGWGVRRAFRELTGLDLSAREINDLSTGGGPQAGDARRVLAGSGRATGRAVGALLNVLDPDVVVVGGGMAGAAAPWKHELHEGIVLEALAAVAGTPVILSQAGPQAALRGAALWSAHHQEGSP